nr:MAG TPA: hypothetical protein [Bacteriophage sp.]
MQEILGTHLLLWLMHRIKQRQQQLLLLQERF